MILRSARFARSTLAFDEVFVRCLNWGRCATTFSHEILPIRKGRAIRVEVVSVATFRDVHHDKLFTSCGFS
jgi:hypothetical protein